MLFSSADYPLFLIAVFFIYQLLGSGGRVAIVARVLVLLLLGDLVYLLLTKDVATLWDPVGATIFRSLAKNAPSARPLGHYALGLGLFVAATLYGRRFSRLLEHERAQSVAAFLAAALLGLFGVAIAVASRQGQLALLTHGLGAVGHLVYLAILGLAVGAAQKPEGRRLGRLLVLLLVSAIFYHAWAAGMPGAYKYLLLLILATITLDYYLALWIDRARARWARRLLLVLSLVANLGVLCLFKYLGFLMEISRSIAGWAHLGISIEPLTLILPAGISFHTFQSLSYTIDVYRRQLKPTRSIVTFATFVLFFPQLVAGPIVRAQEFIPQLEGPERGPSDANEGQGLFRIVIGLVKKIVLADVLAIAFVDRVFAEPRLFSSLEILLAIYAYAFQIYLDFSAYSDIAIGSAQLLGFTFPENFDTPYRAANLQEFWRRWHISLSTWLRDYLYIPLGGSQGASWKTYRNLVVTMLLGGLWHGASWTFIVWGALHGGGLAMTRVWQRYCEDDFTDEGRAGRAAAWTSLIAVAGGVAHYFAASAYADALARLPFDAAWVHLIAGWLYVTPAWAALTVWLSAQPPPGLLYGGEVTHIAWSKAATPLRAVFLAICGIIVAAIASGVVPLTSLSGDAARRVIAPGLLRWGALSVLTFTLIIAALSDLAEEALSVEFVRRRARQSLRRGLAMVLTFHYVCFGWVFFRASSFSAAREMLAQLGTLTDAVNVSPLAAAFFRARSLSAARDVLAQVFGTLSNETINVSPLAAASLSLAVAAHFFPSGTYRWLGDSFVALPSWGRAAVLSVAALLLRQVAQPHIVPFIYFQF